MFVFFLNLLEFLSLIEKSNMYLEFNYDLWLIDYKIICYRIIFFRSRLRNISCFEIMYIRYKLCLDDCIG